MTRIQLVPINHIDLWEVDTCSYLRANLSEADQNLFMSETGAPPVPTCRLIEEEQGSSEDCITVPINFVKF
jgi:hypothetical protein